MMYRRLIYGIATYIPGVKYLRAKGTGGTGSARYCYSVWLRHLVMAGRGGFDTCPGVIAELGPGDSIGIGLAAMLSGSGRYFAFDVVEHAEIEKNLVIFDELINLFRMRAPIPGNIEFPKIEPRLDNYRFPDDILTEERLKRALDSQRIEKIRSSIVNCRQPQSLISYKVPWYEAHVVEAETVDMVFSQAVLEHVDDLDRTYRAMNSWLKPDGFISHTIDYRCHGTADDWNGHWAHPEWLWKLFRGKRAFLLNRQPHSAQLSYIKRAGFKVSCDVKTLAESKLTLQGVAPEFRTMTQEDLLTAGSFIQGVKDLS